MKELFMLGIIFERLCPPPLKAHSKTKRVHLLLQRYMATRLSERNGKPAVPDCVEGQTIFETHNELCDIVTKTVPVNAPLKTTILDETHYMKSTAYGVRDVSSL